MLGLLNEWLDGVGPDLSGGGISEYMMVSFGLICRM